jgi:hypothetical protein
MDGDTKSDGPEIVTSTTDIRTETPTVAGARLQLDAGRDAPAGTRFRWSQIEGPPVVIPDPAKPSIEITIPAGTDRLGFLLIAAREGSVRAVKVNVPVYGEASQNSWGARTSAKVKADAGDDQIGLVGHRVTLNGSQSRPGSGDNARWLQVLGPPIRSPQRQGFFFSFIPTAPGNYKFLLLVSGDGELSEPDEVAVVVGSPPGAPGAASPPSPLAVQAPPPPPAPTAPNLDQTLSAAIPKIPNGTRLASNVADVMEAIAQRTNLYESFSVLQAELVRRLDVVIPNEAAQRAAWTEGVFSPLTAYTAGQLLGVGLDLRQPQGQFQPMTPAQQEQIRDHFERLARAFRAVSVSR